MVKDTKTFGAGRWLAEILQALGSFRTIHQFIRSQEALDAYLNTVEVMTGGEHGIEVTHDPETIRHWHDMISSDVKKAGSFYDSQMVVLASTYFELIMKDFFAAVFTRHPIRMYEFIPSGENQGQKGFVNLKEVLDAGSLPQLLSSLVGRVTEKVARDSFPSQLKHLTKVTKLEIPAELKDRLTALVERRNRIVHAASDEVVGEADVEAALDTCLDTIKFLAEAAAANSIPLDEYATFGL